MRHLFTFVLVCSLYTVNAQYHFFPNLALHYSSPISDELFTVQFDSVRVHPNGIDTTWYLYKIVEEQSGLPGSCTHSTQGFHWLCDSLVGLPSRGGKRIYITTNKFGDSIEFQGRGGDPNTWTMYKFPSGGWIEATSTRFHIPIFGITDFSREITLSVKKANGSDSNAHIFHGQKFILTLNYGIQESFNWREFPFDTTRYTIIGNTKRPELGIQNVDAASVFDIQPGNEIHFETNCRTFIGGGDFIDSQWFEKHFFLTRDTLSTADSLVFTYSRAYWIYTHNSATSSRDTLRGLDTLAETISILDFAFLGAYNRQSVVYSDGSDAYLYDYLNSGTPRRVYQSVRPGYNLDLANNCLSPISGYSGPDEVLYLQGLGLVGLNHSQTGSFEKTKELLYYQKGIETWGTAFDFSGVISGLEVLDQRDFLLSPNPVVQSLNIQSEDAWEVYCIYNLQGQKLLQGEPVPGEAISVSELLGGMYIIELRSELGSVSKPFVKLKDY